MTHHIILALTCLLCVSQGTANMQQEFQPESVQINAVHTTAAAQLTPEQREVLHERLSELKNKSAEIQKMILMLELLCNNQSSKFPDENTSQNEIAALGLQHQDDISKLQHEYDEIVKELSQVIEQKAGENEELQNSLKDTQAQRYSCYVPQIIEICKAINSQQVSGATILGAIYYLAKPHVLNPQNNIRTAQFHQITTIFLLEACQIGLKTSTLSDNVKQPIATALDSACHSTVGAYMQIPVSAVTKLLFQCLKLPHQALIPVNTWNFMGLYMSLDLIGSTRIGQQIACQTAFDRLPYFAKVIIKSAVTYALLTAVRTAIESITYDFPLI